jgi:hypothetical protein
MLRLIIVLTSAFLLSAAQAKVDDLTFVENREFLWHEGVEPLDDQPIRLGEHQEPKANLTKKLPEELSVPLSLL